MIMAACIPSLRPFVKALGRSIRKSAPKPLEFVMSNHDPKANRGGNQPLDPASQPSGTTAVQTPVRAYCGKNDFDLTSSTQNLTSGLPTSLESSPKSPTIKILDLGKAPRAGSSHSV